MFFGFGFVFWGGQHTLTQTSWDHLAAGSAIAAIGGSISAFITKTFLSVHKLSLQQFKSIFRPTRHQRSYSDGSTIGRQS